MPTPSDEILDVLERPVLLVRPYERKKRDLVETAAEAARMLAMGPLDEWDPLHNDAVRHFCGLNLLALIQYYTGQYGQAAALCQREIDLCANLVRNGRPVQWMFFAVEAYLNEARLAALLGRAEEAISRFTKLLEFACHDDELCLGGQAFTRRQLGDAASSHEENRKGFLRRLTAVGGMAVWEANKAFLLLEDYEGLLRFLDGQEFEAFASSRVFASALLEARVKALMGLDRLAEASDRWEQLRGLVQGDDACLTRLAVLAADLYAAMRQPTAAADWRQRCLAGVRDRRDIEAWYLEYRCLLLCWKARERDQLDDLCHLALTIGQECGDQIAFVKTSCLMIRILSERPEARERVQVLCRSLEETLARCHYRSEATLAYAELGRAYGLLDGDLRGEATRCLHTGWRRAQALPDSPLKAHVERLTAGGMPFPGELHAPDRPAGHEWLDELWQAVMASSPFDAREWTTIQPWRALVSR
jgi:tetratricopeptide (TPR) repeat protein